MRKLILVLILAISCFALDNHTYLTDNQTTFTKCELSCPNTKDGYFTRFKKFDLRTGSIECFVYDKRDFINAVSEVSTVNSYCIKEFKADEPNLNKIDTSAVDRITKHENTFFNNSNNSNFINAPKFLLSSLTFDSQIIDIKKSLEQNQIKLNSGYTIYANGSINDTTSFYTSIKNTIKSTFGVKEAQIESFKRLELISSIQTLLSDSIIFIMHFLNENNEILVKLKAFLLVTILPTIMLTATAQKASLKFQKKHDNEDIIEKIGVGVFIIIVFFISTVKIDTSKDNHISQTIFQNFSRPILYAGAEFADSMSNNTTIAYLKSNAKDVGISSTEDIKSLMMQQSQLSKVQKWLSYILNNYCYSNYDIKKMRNEVKDKFGVDSNFPSSETVNFNDNVLGKRTVNFYQYLKNQDKKTESDMVSVSSCFNIEQKYLNNKNELSIINNLLTKYQDSRFNETLNTQLDILTKIEMRNSAELGFLNAPLLATTSIALNSIGVFQKDSVDTKIATEKTLKSYRKSQGYEVGDIAENQGAFDSSINSILSSMPYLLLPGADSIQMRIAGLIKTDKKSESSKFIKSIVTKAVALIPGGQVVALASTISDMLSNLRSSDFFVTVVASILTIIIMMFIILYLPIIAISMASFAVIFFYFLNVEIFYLTSPFIVAFAFVSNQLEILKSVFKTLLILAFKPVLIVISVVLALFAFEFFTTINQSLLEQQFEPIFAMTEAMQVNSIGSASTYMFSDFGLIFIKGFISMGISIVSIIVCFYLVLNGANLILDMFRVREASFDAQSILGDKIEGKSNKMNMPTV